MIIQPLYFAATVGFILGIGLPARGQENLVVENFEADLSKRWEAYGPLSANLTKELLPNATAEGSVLSVQAAGRARLAGRQSLLLPTEIKQFTNLSFSARLKDPVRVPLALEIWLAEADQRRRFWRRVDLSQSTWKEFQLPLRSFREEQVPRWEKIKSIQVVTRQRAEFFLDTLTWEKEPGRTAVPDKDDFIRILFAGRKPTIIGDDPDVLVLADIAAFDLKAFTSLRRRADAYLVERLGPRRTVAAKPVLAVFATAADYRQGTLRWAKELSAVLDPPLSDGFTLGRLALSSWSPQHETNRPVYIHEYCHALLCDWLEIPVAGEWLHEGLATLTQAHVFPSSGLERVVRAEAGRLSQDRWLAIVNGKRIALRDYWLAAVTVETILDHYQGNEGRNDLLAVLRSECSTDLGRHWGKHGLPSADELFAQVKATCHRRYAARFPAPLTEPKPR